MNSNTTLQNQDNYSYEDVFGDLKIALFSKKDAANYLEISIPNLSKLVQSKKLLPRKVIGRIQFFAAHDLKIIKSSKTIK
jgi:hypothetical protein